MNPSTAQARAIVVALAKHGITDVVLAPGSRNTPLSIALFQAQHALKLTVRIDERTAAFTALGMAKRTNRPVAVLCTSGTAAANFYPAVYEAHEAGVPLIVMTADRPDSVRGRGANQTIDQVGMFGSPIRADWDLPLASDQDDVYWELGIAQAVLAAVGDEFTAPGPVHLNIPFAEPLVPSDNDASWSSAVVTGELPVARTDEDIELSALLEDMKVTTDGTRGVIIISDPHSAQSALTLAETLGWPVLAEPGSMARAPHVAIARYARLLADADFVATHQPDVVITAGRFGLSRAVAAFVKSAPAHIAVGKYPLDADPFETAAHHVSQMPLPVGVNPAVGWLADWQEADAAVHVDAHTFSSKNVVRAVHDSATQRDQLWVSASMAIREADDAFALRGAMPMVFMNRGANGIDGLIASASGAALKHPGRTFLIIGDVAFLHDMSSLVIPALEQRPNLTIVVLDNNGGKIFKTLEQGAAEFDNLFDRVYGTPHGLALDAIATSAGWSSTSVESLDDLRAALADGTSVIVANLSQ
ncbi:MAG: hypothetical protein RL441_1136 [Actinomycetota bacterium]